MIKSFPKDPLAQGILTFLIALSWHGPSREMGKNQLKVTTRESQHDTAAAESYFNSKFGREQKG